MSVAASLNDSVLSVDPGSEVTCEIQVRNTGDVIDQFAVDVVGAAAEWSRIEPSLVNLLPGASATVVATFAPPRSAEVLAGVVSFGIRVLSREDPEGSTVQEGEVEVTPFTELAAEFVPTKRRGRRRAKFRLAVDNTGNAPTSVEVLAVPEEDDAQISVRPATVSIEPGTTVLVAVRVVPHKRFLKGETKTVPFQAMVLRPDAESIAADGVMLHEQLLPKWLLPAAAAVVALGAVLVGLWFAFLRPQVQSIAKAETQGQVSQAVSAAAQASKAADQASQAAKVAQGGGSGGGGSASGSAGRTASGGNGSGAADGGAAGANAGGGGSGGGGSAGPGGTGGSASNATEFRITTGANPVTNGSFQNFSYTAPNHQSMDISDLVLQNPRGDTGILRVMFGTNIILEEGLANFRDLDYHYVVALHVSPDQPVTIALSCSAPGAGATQCTPSVSFSGRTGQNS